MDYDTFIDKGLRQHMSNDYTKITCHTMFTVKHNGQHKARFITSGHLTQPAIESVYSGIVSIQSIHLILLITELNDLTIYQADVRNAYLEAYTKEKIYFITGTEFTTLEWRVTYSLYLEHYMGYEQVENDFIKFSQILFTLKDLCTANPILMYGCDAMVIHMNM